MTDVKIARALLSVSDKTGLVELGRALARHGVELVSTGGTAKALREAGLEVRDVSDLTGFPEMMDGRVKTLHPKVHGGLLAVRDDPAHAAAMAEHGIGAIDLVVVNLYPVRRRPWRGAPARDEIIENIDIGGPVDGPLGGQEPCLRRDRHRSGRLCRADRGAGRERRHDVARSAQAPGGQGFCRDRRL